MFEKALQTQTCGLVLAWMNWLPNGVVRRLQLAAEKGDGLAILFRERESKNSPAALRLKLHPNAQGLQVKVLKARGTYRYQSAHLCFPGNDFPKNNFSDGNEQVSMFSSYIN